MSLFDRVVNFFKGKGWTENQARGIAGNLVGESGLDHTIRGDGGRAYGLAQWHPDRQANFRRVFGFDITRSSFDQQLEFIQWELNNTERAAGNHLRGTTTLADAVRSFMQRFERPANMSSFGNRLTAAGTVSGSTTTIGPLRQIERTIVEGLGGDAEWWTNPDSSLTDLDPTGISGFIASIFDPAFAARFLASLIGVILIAVALVAFIMSGNNSVADSVGKVIPQ